MARPRKPTSQLSYGGYGLDLEEDKRLIRLLQDNDYTAKQLVRYLLRKWIKAKESEIPV